MYLFHPKRGKSSWGDIFLEGCYLVIPKKKKKFKSPSEYLLGAQCLVTDLML